MIWRTDGWQRLFLLLLWLPVSVSAHEIRPAALHIKEISQGEFQANWKVPARNDTRLSLQPLLNGEPLFAVQTGYFMQGAYIEQGKFTHPDGLMGSQIAIQGLDSTFTDVMLRLESLDGSVLTARLSPENPVYDFAEDASGWGLVTTYTNLGIQHILLGVDHLLFVACFVLIAGFSRRLVWAITGFSIAHSVTLGLAALEIVQLPVPAVEAVIALSILFMAWEIARGRTDTLTYRYPIVVSASFGLLHGFGFAAVLAEIGLPKNEGLLALLCFNVGVEIGQLLFIAALFLSVILVRQLRFVRLHWLKQVATYGIGGFASLWLIERVLAF